MNRYINSKKGLGTAQFIGLVITIVVVAAVLLFIFRADISKWLGFVPDYGTPAEKDLGTVGGDELVEGICSTNDFCLVEYTACECFAQDEYVACSPGQYCVFGTGCLTHLDKFSALKCKASLSALAYPSVCMSEDNEKTGSYCTCPDNLVAFASKFTLDTQSSETEQKQVIEAIRKEGGLNSVDDWAFSICNPSEYCIYGFGCSDSLDERLLIVNGEKTTQSESFALEFVEDINDIVYVAWSFQSKSAILYIKPNGNDDFKKWLHPGTDLWSIQDIKDDMFQQDVTFLQNLLNSKTPTYLTENIINLVNQDNIQAYKEGVDDDKVTEAYVNSKMYWGNPVALDG